MCRIFCTLLLQSTVSRHCLQAGTEMPGAESVTLCCSKYDPISQVRSLEAPQSKPFWDPVPALLAAGHALLDQRLAGRPQLLHVPRSEQARPQAGVHATQSNAHAMHTHSQPASQASTHARMHARMRARTRVCCLC